MKPNDEGSKKSPKISAVILARNEEANIRYCLDTLGWCDEIVVTDMESSDCTAAIAREYTDKVYPHPLTLAFDIAKKFAVEKASGDWVFLIDADEMVPKALGLALRTIAEEGKADVVEVPFNHYIMGAKVRRSGWGYTPQPRFFRRGKVIFGETIHRYFRKADGVATVGLPLNDQNCIIHFNYTDSAHFVEKLNRYTNVEAQHLFESGTKFSYFGLLRAAAREFSSRFFGGKGYSEGPRGFSLSLMMAFYRALSFIKLWEKQEFTKEPVQSIYERERRAILAEWEK
ncbi:MAG: glycosyltransferase family 2 protein [Syntrophales bacterium]